MLSIYFNIFSLVFVVLVFGLSVILNIKKTDKFKQAAKLTFMFVFSITMFCLVYALADLQNADRVGKILSFIILSNAYAGTIKTIELILSGLKKN
ncbi:MAG: hypothetical protein A2015_06055 [Spirochaetes bacterium GWF1_31_7]|nr:MAG: hypothetical protein A2Y30_07655 [Spirochaetes bacterium GWE1_32_154]OHD50819.1 MAG: hypothetical protein A2Y29_02685 [Spirochaetes bacterium GWE2_31_10]OHD52756.1 MAG: hypothetical protein A2015_06055 [Spirochaetes bacterium GWF1_31_7]OHD82196.1 MAG: hypothetical protein A2355_18375 [Spirochaetes bacterium RIFOXYB1_FULL_32_8]HBD95433.1 hypothetical protein [Spirochaetia bacterium]